MPNLVVKITSSDAYAASSSQEVITPDVSPVFAQYKQYLQACYNARVLAPADKYLPTLEAPYINLAMVSKEHCGPEQRDEFTRQTLHGGVDQILQSKTPINIGDLLTPKEDGGPVRFVLVEGPPGIGKSTFAWEVCRRWDDIESLREYHTVMLLKLREKWVLDAASLPTLFRYEHNPELSKSISEELAKTQGRNLLLVLDGLDEVSHSFHENSVINSILCRQLLPKCTIILTTRPSAKHILESICQPRIDKHVEIIGFTEEERVRYITEVFSKEPELQVDFLKYMFLVPHIKSMMYVPLNCAIIAQVYYESQSSRHVTIPKTRTQLYQALTHSLLVRHMKMKDSNFYCTSMLPEGLNREEKEMFMTLAKFAFDSYHALYLEWEKKENSRKVTFFKEDIPEGLVHFGFMNESTEMYAGKGVEQTFSFLHLSLQEYLAAWHLANSYSTEFQVAYHMLATEPPLLGKPEYNIEDLHYKGDNEEEKALLLAIMQKLVSIKYRLCISNNIEQRMWSLEEPAIFLAGITGLKCQDMRNNWESYFSREATHLETTSVLLQSLYEAQNHSLLPYYFNADCSCSDWRYCRKSVIIDTELTPYDIYALSYCIPQYLEEVVFTIGNNDDVSRVETFVKGVNDHCKSTTTRVKVLTIEIEDNLEEVMNKCLIWIMKSNFLTQAEELYFQTKTIHSITNFLKSFVNLQSLKIFISSPASWEWLSALKSLSKLEVLEISGSEKCSPPPTDLQCWPIKLRLTEVVLDIKFHCNTRHHHSETDVLIDSVLKSVLRSNAITKLVLPNISRGTMAGVRSILLHCPSLTTLELKRTRLGYDGILYICSALRYINTSCG